MSPRYDDEWIGAMLDIEGRFGDVPPEALLVETGLLEGQAVVDMGCGPGLLTFAAASVVGSHGKVYAVDIEQKMLDLVNSRVESSGIDNVATVFSDGARVPLPDRIADYAICSEVLHYPDSFGDRVDMTRDVKRLVRAGGRILFIEWKPQEGDDPATRLPPEDTEQILRQVNLQYEKPIPVGDRQYAIAAMLSEQGEEQVG